MECRRPQDTCNDLELLVADFVEAYGRLHSDGCSYFGNALISKRASTEKRSWTENGKMRSCRPGTPKFSKPFTPRPHFEEEPELEKLYHRKDASQMQWISTFSDSCVLEQNFGITDTDGHQRRSNYISALASVTPTTPSSIPHPLKPRSSDWHSIGQQEQEKARARSHTPRVLSRLIEEADLKNYFHTSGSVFGDYGRRLRKKFIHLRKKLTESREDMSRESFVESVLDPLVCFVIVLNLVLTGVSLDHEDWSGWYVIDWIFAVVYLLELSLKLVLLGWREMYLGKMWKWSFFDTIVVVLALVDLLIEASGSIALARVARLCRLARLLRLMRTPALKELIMFLRGMFRGMRVLFWCLSSLLLPVFIVGMLVSQALKNSDQDIDGNFSTVAISMFTTIRCMCGDCTDSLGRPLIVLFAKDYGWHLALFYTVFILVSIFGVFNLITAIFLEGTMQAAKSDTNLQRGIRNASDKKFANNIKSMVFIFWQTHQMRKTQGSGGRSVVLNSKGVDKFNIKDALDLEIDQAFYDEMVRTPIVRDILDDMGLVDDEIVDLFEMLDVDKSGSLDLIELVTGLYKLRGDATKRDLVAIAYLIYSLQDSVRALTLSQSVPFSQDCQTLAADGALRLSSSTSA